MDDIPQDVLYEANEAGHYESPYAFLRVVAQHHADRAERLRALRKKSWQSNSRELDGVADHIRAYADQLEAFAANNPDGVTLVEDDDQRTDAEIENGVEITPAEQAGRKGRKKKDVPQLPGNTGRCASFRRADADDQTLCGLERGHEGDHIQPLSPDGPITWPRRTGLDSGWTKDDEIARQGLGQVCGDVVVLPDGQALNCALPFGHGGDEHYDGRFRLWPRGEGTSRHVSVCDACNADTHTCPGCGEPLNHAITACAACSTESVREIEEGVGGQTGLPELGTVPPCADRQDSADPGSDTCMLPKGHTGKHIGHRGERWIQVVVTEAHGLTVTHAAGSTATVYPTPGGMAIVEVAQAVDTLGDIAEQQRAALAIPEPRETVENVEREMRAEVAVIAAAKEEVTAIVASMTGDEPIGTTVNVGGIEFVKHSDNPFGDIRSAGPVLGNPFAKPTVVTQGRQAEHGPFAPPNPSPVPATVTLGNPFQAPAPPPAAFLPPHMVPGAPKAHQSHSSITTMEKCGLQYRLKYRDGFGDDTPAWWNVAGTAFHTVVQAIEATYATALATEPVVSSMWDPIQPAMSQVREAGAMWKATFADLVTDVERSSGKARSTWKAAKGNKEGEAFWREYGEDLCRSYAEHRRRFLAEPEGWRLLNKPGGEGWAHEVEFNATVDGVLLRGFIDAAWISADGCTILVEDFKSGSSEGDPFQPKLYGAALRALGFIGERRVITRFYEARKGAHSATVDLTPADDAEVSYRANTAATMDRMGIFPANPSGYNCSTCAVKSRCPIMATRG